MKDGYDSVFPLFMPWYNDKYDDGYPIIEAEAALSSFPI